MLAMAWVAISLTGAALAYRWRHRDRRLCLLIIVIAAALVLAIPVTGTVAPNLMTTAAKLLTGTVILSIIAVFLVRRALPGLVSRHDRTGAALTCGGLGFGYLVLAVMLTMAADDQLQVDHLPQLRTRSEFINQRDAPSRPAGVLVQATVSDRNPESVDGAVASVSCPAIGSIKLPGPGRQLPERYLLEFPSGPPLVTGGIDSSAQTWGWPSNKSGACVLHRGAPVVIWGVLSRNMGIGQATSQTGLADIRVIAVGDITSFLSGYVPAAVHTGKAVLGLAALNAGLAAVMIAVGGTAYIRLTRFGTDAAPRITWRR